MKLPFFLASLKREVCIQFDRKEAATLNDRFISGIELVYSLILACGVVKILDILHGDVFGILKATWHTMIVSGLFLLRFFFAPSQNLRLLSKHAKGWKWTILPFDGLSLLALSFFFYFMCLNIENAGTFYRLFFYTLYFDVIWLVTILMRCKNSKELHNRIWVYNNLAFIILFLIVPQSWPAWFGLALLNSLIDFGTTYSDYFRS